MIGQATTNHRPTKSSEASRLGAALAVCAGLWLPVMTTDARAQAVEGVIVDLSVISDGGGVGGGTSPDGSRALRLPPGGTVRSRLHVAPKTKVTLRAPTAADAKTAAAPAPKPKPETLAKAKSPAPRAAAPAAKSEAKPAAAPAAKAKPRTATAAKAKAPVPPAPPKLEKAPPPLPKTAAAPPAPPAPKAPPSPPAPETAAAPAGVPVKPGRALRVEFDEAATRLPEDAKAALDALANAMRESKDLRLQLMAYAGASGLSTSKARRISLSRALAVRSFLIDNGVRSTQIDVRALGNKTSETPVNRVDVNIAKR